jgi:hypothetical protein
MMRQETQAGKKMQGKAKAHGQISVGLQSL